MAPNATEVDLEQLFTREGPRLRAYLSALVGATEAADLLQETFVRARCAHAQFEGDDVGAWVRTIARNIAIDHLRRSAVNVIPGSGDIAAAAAESRAGSEPDPERRAIRGEMDACIGEFVRRLPDRDAEMIVLADMRGLPDQEIATTLGITLGAAKVRLHRARARLRAVMEHGCELYRDEDGLACDRKA